MTATNHMTRISRCFRRSKFPQILTIYQQKSAQGISLKSLTIEIVSYSVSMLYNFTNGYRLMNYFEYVVLIVQDYMLVAIVLYYRKSITQKAIGITAVYFLVLTLFGSSILPKNILTLCIVSLLCESFYRNFQCLIFLFPPARHLTSFCYF